MRTIYDPKHYYFERRSGIPHGYFDDGRRRRRRLALVAFTVLELVAAALLVAFIVPRS